MEILEVLRGIHSFVKSKNSSADYAIFIQRFVQRQHEFQFQNPMLLAPEDFYIGSDVILGDGVVIEPGAVAGHGVALEVGVRILSNAVVKNAQIGALSVVKEGAVIGDDSFTFSKDSEGKLSGYRVWAEWLLARVLKLGV